MIILGSGLSGCLAANLIPGSIVYDTFSETSLHTGLLRFSSTQIGDALGIPLKKVIVYKSIYEGYKHVPISNRAIVRYSGKTNGVISARSICNTDPVERYIPPHNFHEILLKRINVIYKANIPNLLSKTPIINTIPLPIICSYLNLECYHKPSNPIFIFNAKLLDCDIHLTNYYIGDTYIYRASIIGNLLSIESMRQIETCDIQYVLDTFGINKDFDFIECKKNEFGKLTTLDDELRKPLLRTLTENFDIYSLGRFATWRNIKLDDVFHDIQVIKKIINLNNYDKAKL